MASVPYIVVIENAAGEPHIQIRASNGKILFSSEVYQEPRNLDNAIRILRDLDASTPVVRKRDGKTYDTSVLGNV